MIISKNSKRNITLFAAAFLLCGILHILLYSVEFTLSFSQFFCGVLTLYWAVSVGKRVTDGKLRVIMLWIAACLLLHFCLQIMRYTFFYESITVGRYLWYAYYVPMIAEPLLCFFLAVHIYRPRTSPLPRAYMLLILAGIVLALGVLTNDLHFWAKSFPNGVMDGIGQEKNEWLYYIVTFFICGLYAMTYAVILKKDLRFARGRYRWLSLVPIMVSLVYFSLFSLNVGIRLFGARLWNLGEILAFCIIATLEACIHAGMIPANMGYESIFSAAFLPAVILDSKGAPVYRTAAADYPFSENEDTKVMSHAIRGGSVEWTVDMRQVHELNRQLEDANQQIEARNAYIAEENRIKQERAELETRNRMYDSITQIVKPQLERIDELLCSEEGSVEKLLPKLTVLSAYIKRRSNMELLSAAGTLTVVELVSALTESLDYIRLCGINTALSSIGTGSYPAAMVISAYERVEAIVEDSLDTLSALMVTVRSDKQRLIVRMMLRADDFTYNTGGDERVGAGFSSSVTITKDRQDMLIVLTFTEGGERK